MSPILSAFGGAIEKNYLCDSCNQTKTVLETFVSLSFQKLSLEDITTIRTKFSEKGYSEGLVYREQPHQPASFVQRMIGKKGDRVPIVTIRDYLCHLNFTRSDKL